MDAPVFAPVPSEELPLLTEAMLEDDDQPSPAEDDMPPTIVVEHHDLPLLADAAQPEEREARLELGRGALGGKRLLSERATEFVERRVG